MPKEKEVNDNEIVEQFEESDCPALTAPELAEELGMSRQGVAKRLRELEVEKEVVRSKKPGRDRFYWLSER